MRTSIPKLHSITFKSGPFADNVMHIGPPDRHDIPVINVLHGAAVSMLQEVALIGYDINNKEYVATSSGNAQRAAYMFARAHLFMLRDADD